MLTGLSPSCLAICRLLRNVRATVVRQELQSLAKVAVTVCPESHLISKPSEHQRVLLALTITWPVCGRLDCRLL